MSEEMNARPAHMYDVALWLSWPSLFPEHVGLVEAYGTYAAVLSLMETYGVEKVAHATARLVEHPRIDRWDHLYIPLAFRQKVRKR
ncbi:MAG: hypothetical protein ACJ788_28750 [Ktedonobacteraceae bacterium]|jgi:hypothetical protein